ncbi:MAG: DUF2357 domain-containing protein [Oscillospiraceae bacterium]|nr:DUF2357 domain-containing protein [Oscillospiraceae bacterium]
MARKENNRSLIDPLYQKFTRSVIRALGSSEFYRFFMESLANADNEFQFSNRKLEKTVDLAWVDAIEEALPAFQTIISAPRNVIVEEELIVNVANAKKADSATIRHLAQHAAQVEDFNAATGDVRPSKLMQRYREDTVSQYENRLVYTTMESAFHFVKIRHDALFSAMSDEFGAKLKLRSDMDSATEHVHLDMFLHIRNTESALNTDAKNAEVFERISRIYRVLGMFMGSQYARELSKASRVKGTINKTNVLKRNPNYRKVTQLLEFLRRYDEIGYTIKVVEQSPRINEVFQQDIFHNILFNYLVLKGYLEDPADRQIPEQMKERKRALKPKFIREVIEELTEDYDLPDVEIRKVLIEELTKQQLMQEEAQERRRLVEEQAQRKREEKARQKAEEQARKEQLRKEREAEREQLRREKEAEEARRVQERMEREIEDRRRSKLLKKEIERFNERLSARREARAAAEEKTQAVTRQEDYADAVRQMEQVQQRRQEAAERLKRQKAEEALRLQREKRAEAERLREEEQQRIARARQEEEERARAEQRERDRPIAEPVVEELQYFRTNLQVNLRQRSAQASMLQEAEKERERRRQLRKEQREERRAQR